MDLVTFTEEIPNGKLHFSCSVIRVKSGITCIISHNYARIKIDSYDSLPPEKH